MATAGVRSKAMILLHFVNVAAVVISWLAVVLIVCEVSCDMALCYIT